MYFGPVLWSTYITQTRVREKASEKYEIVKNHALQTSREHVVFSTEIIYAPSQQYLRLKSQKILLAYADYFVFCCVVFTMLLIDFL